MTAFSIAVALAITTATAALILIIRELNLHALNMRVSKAVSGVPSPPAPLQEMSGWLASLGARYRRFYSAESLEQLRAFVQSSGFNPRRALPIWIGIKIVCMAIFPIAAVFVGELLGKSTMDLLTFALIGEVIGIMGPRLILTALKRRFAREIHRGTPDMIDLLVVCSDAGMGLEGGLERVAEEMQRSNPAMAQVLNELLDDLRIMPNRQDAFAKLGSTSDGLRRFGAMVSQSLQYGTPLSQALRAIAEELRRGSIIKLEERAHQLGAKLILPMAVFLLPAMFIILGGSSFLHLTRAFQH